MNRIYARSSYIQKMLFWASFRPPGWHFLNFRFIDFEINLDPIACSAVAILLSVSCCPTSFFSPVHYIVNFCFSQCIILTAAGHVEVQITGKKSYRTGEKYL